MRQAGRRLRVRANVAVVLVLAVVLLANGLAALSIVSSQQALAAAQDHSVALLEQQAQFGELHQVKSNIALAKAAQQVGASTEIDWRDYLGGVVRLSSAQGVTITAITSSSSSPLELFPQAAVPFAVPRVATLALKATTSSLASAKAWLEALATMPGFVSAALTEVTLTEVGYELTCSMDVGPAAQSGWFADKPSTKVETSVPEAPRSEAAKPGVN